MVEMRFVIYQDAIGSWRWQLVSSNGQIMADSGEAYIDKNNVKDAVNTITENIKTGNFAVEYRDE